MLKLFILSQSQKGAVSGLHIVSAGGVSLEALYRSSSRTTLSYKHLSMRSFDRVLVVLLLVLARDAAARVGSHECRAAAKDGEFVGEFYGTFPTCTYKGIPYATPPVGKLRFMPTRVSLPLSTHINSHTQEYIALASKLPRFCILIYVYMLSRCHR